MNDIEGVDIAESAKYLFHYFGDFFVGEVVMFVFPFSDQAVLIEKQVRSVPA